MASNALALAGGMSAAEHSLALGVSVAQPRPRVEMGGVLIDQVDLASAVERIRGFLHEGPARRSHGVRQIVTVNLDFLSIAARDPRFRAVINASDLAVADGMPLVWVSRLRRQGLTERVTGVELVNQSCRLATEQDRSVFLLGAAPGVADRAARTLEARHPGLRVAGVYSPPVGPIGRSENQHMRRTINAAAPDLLFVALGAPRQDLWIQANRARLDVSVAIGVGCVLDLLAGKVSRAPSWMQETGLEWAFRLAQEPRRLWRRYLLNDLPMLGQLLLSRSGGTPTLSTEVPA